MSVVDLLLLAAGLALLWGGGDLLVRGASQLARAFGISPLVIGLTVVAFGTSAPELAVSLQAALGGTADLAVGNVVGSNIFNVLFILGLSALVLPLVVSRRLVRVDVPLMVAVSVLVLILSLDGRLTTADGLVLLATMAAYLAWTAWASRREPPDEPDPSGVPPAGEAPPVRGALVGAAGLALLVLGARWVVAGAVALAEAFGVPQVIVGLTIVAAGTSLPEAATSIVAAVRGQRDIAIGNVVGSNIFNLTLILGATAVTAGTLPVAEGVMAFDMVVMTAVAIACLPVFFTGHLIARWEGGLFFAYYVAYTGYLVLSATGHVRVAPLAGALALFAVPLVVITLGVFVERALWRRRG